MFPLAGVELSVSSFSASSSRASWSSGVVVVGRRGRRCARAAFGVGAFERDLRRFDRRPRAVWSVGARAVPVAAALPARPSARAGRRGRAERRAVAGGRRWAPGASPLPRGAAWRALAERRVRQPRPPASASSAVAASTRRGRAPARRAARSRLPGRGGAALQAPVLRALHRRAAVRALAPQHRRREAGEGAVRVAAGGGGVWPPRARRGRASAADASPGGAGSTPGAAPDSSSAQPQPR